jgi:hypothetical protein
MGSISLQSTQVTAKNSTKVKLLCLGIKLGLAVCVTLTGAVAVTEAISDGATVTAPSVRGAAQENATNRETQNTNKLSFRMAHINVTEQNKYRHSNPYRLISKTQTEKALQAQDNACTHWA